MTEQEKMQAGLWFNANFDPALCAEREQTAELCQALNSTPYTSKESRKILLARLLPGLSEKAGLLSPFQCDYGFNITIGEGSFLNRGCYLMDCAPIALGKHVFMGPDCGVYTAVHPFDAANRNTGLEKALPVTIEDEVWLGGHVTILPGVTIGRGSIIGAGSVVTKDVPAGVVAAGNPCKVLRALTGEDLAQCPRQLAGQPE